MSSNISPYKLLSEIYDGYWGTYSRNYLSFLQKIIKKHSIKNNSVLDLGCGTGVLIHGLTDSVKHLVGLDSSAEMLEVSKDKCRELSNVKFVNEDMRSFSLNKKFDLIISFFDTLNYIRKLNQLEDIFKNVHRHLEPNGFFVFDVVNETHFIENDGYRGGFKLRGVYYKVISSYNEERKTAETTFVFDDGREIHRQIPIEYEDVKLYAACTGFEIVDCFTDRKHKVVDGDSNRVFFILKKC